ncbi:hypothetical protein ACHAWO_010255 [Cyclotella atomus]|jgi:uncharacterized surface protein with fasciclin (FAS1) repeats|uniref:FAS1 domain-containing protein n=1 Tax=Cyclotella atomus TaxID=382360 RepID=A0ABD3NYN7_9STRA
MKFLSSILLIASLNTSNAFESYLDEEHIEATAEKHEHHGRELFVHMSKKRTFDKYLNVNNRCCGEDLSKCKCPVRQVTWWGLKRKWEKSCDTTIPRKSSITALALALPVFSTLVGLLKDAGLASTLAMNSSDGTGYTVFAPTNAAFDKLGDLELTEEQIKEVLLYHVVAGTVTSDQLSDGQVVTTLNGQDITIGTTNGVTVNDSTVTGADNHASNGVVHIIDTVLVPELN